MKTDDMLSERVKTTTVKQGGRIGSITHELPTAHTYGLSAMRASTNHDGEARRLLASV